MPDTKKTETKELKVIYKYRMKPVRVPLNENGTVILVAVGGDLEIPAATTAALPKQSRKIKEATQAIYKKLYDQGQKIFFEK